MSNLLGFLRFAPAAQPAAPSTAASEAEHSALGLAGPPLLVLFNFPFALSPWRDSSYRNNNKNTEECSVRFKYKLHAVNIYR